MEIYEPASMMEWDRGIIKYFMALFREVGVAGEIGRPTVLFVCVGYRRT